MGLVEVVINSVCSFKLAAGNRRQLRLLRLELTL